MEQLAKYIKDQQAAGFTNEQIMTACLSVGYTEEQLLPLLTPPLVTAVEGLHTGTATDSYIVANTVETKPVPPLLSVGAYITESFTLVTSYPAYIFGFMVSGVGAVIASMIVAALGNFLVLGLSLGEVGTKIILLMTQCISMLPMLFPVMALLYVFVRREEGLSYWTGLEWAFQKTDSLVILYALITAVTFGGLMLFVIPFFIINIYLLFSLLLFITASERGMNAMLRSTHLVYGNWWAVFFRMMAFGLLVIGLFMGAFIIGGAFFASLNGAGLGFLVISMAIMGVVLFAVTAWGMAATVVLFESLLAIQRTLFVATDYGTARIIYKILAIIGAVTFCALVYFSK